MRIGLTGGGRDADRMIEQAQRAEADGFSALWYPGAIGGDPLVAMALAGRATERIELGTAVLQTYPCHPLLMANRAVATAAAMNRPGFVLGVGPSHAPVIEGMYAMDAAHAGRHTEEYVGILADLLAGEQVSVTGTDVSLRGGSVNVTEPRVPLLVAALGPRLLRVAGERADGTILWMGTAKAVESHVAPRITAAADAAGRPAPRIVAGLPCVVTDDVAAGRAAAAEQFAVYGTLPNYQRILAHGGVDGPAEAAIVGDEASVERQISGLFDAGVTDVWIAPFVVGDRTESRERTMALLRSLVA